MKIRIFFIISLLLTFFNVKPQQVDIIWHNTGDTVIICNNISLSSNVSLINNNTLNYNVSNINFTPYSYIGNTVNGMLGTPLIDDDRSGIIPIGFNFCFFGNQYNQCYIGSNGWVSFSPGQPLSFTSQTIPQFSTLIPRNCIMGPWYDLNPGITTNQCGSNTTRNYIRYRTEGIAPYRRFIVSWVNIPLYGCVTICGTQQIVLYETTNIIENYIERKPICLGWAGGTSTQGLHNSTGTFSITIAGRNSTVWAATNEGWRYTPHTSITPTIIWYVNNSPQGNGQSFNFNNYSSGCYTISVISSFECTPIISSDYIIVCIYDCCDIQIYEN